jgi:DNA-binding GntR family transcriptional regulator
MTQPLYKTIAEKLIDEIESGHYTCGDMLPTEAKLSQKYNVSRITIRSAIQILVDCEYVKKIQGSGTHVLFSGHRSIVERSAALIPYFEEMRLMGKEPRAKIVVFEMVHANTTTAIELSIDINQPLYHYERVLYADNTPYCYEIGYLPIKFFPDFSVEVLSDSRINYMEKKGFPLDYSLQIAHAISASDYLSTHLEVPPKSPLLEVSHITYDNQGNPIEKIRTIFNSEYYRPKYVRTRVRG